MGVEPLLREPQSAVIFKDPKGREGRRAPRVSSASALLFRLGGARWRDRWRPEAHRDWGVQGGARHARSARPPAFPHTRMGTSTTKTTWTSDLGGGETQRTPWNLAC